MNFSPWKRIVAGLSAFVLFFTTCLLGVTSFPVSSQADVTSLPAITQANSDRSCSSLAPVTYLEPGKLVPFDPSTNTQIQALESLFGNSSVKFWTYNFDYKKQTYSNCKYFNYDLHKYALQVDFKEGNLQIVPNSIADVEIPTSKRKAVSGGSNQITIEPGLYCPSWGVEYLPPNSGGFVTHDCFLDDKVVTVEFYNYIAVSDSPVIAISPSIPTDIPGGAANADLTKAAAFAWQEFIALNWPNKQLSNGTIQRATPDTSAVFGSSNSSSISQPLVWESYRNKVEIFPGSGSTLYNKGIGALPGYDALPDYANEYSKSIPACSSTPANDAWVNLDESNEITEANMFAGVVPTAGPVDPEGQEFGGAYPNQQFLYVAKANRAQYNYVKDRQWNLGDDGIKNGTFSTSKKETVTYIGQNKKYPSLDEKSATGHYYVSLPDGTDKYGDVGTIEIKSGWRQINSDEVNKFHTAPVRYYTTENGNVCYEQPDAGNWGMAALHIIHKTPSAPYFIFATFSQADNILDEQGNPVEDANGAYMGTPPATPTTPDIQEVNQDPYRNPAIIESPASSTIKQTFDYLSASLPQEHASTDKRLYYTNINTTGTETSGKPPLPPKTPVSIDKRENDIPPEVIAVNQAAHDAISAYNQENGLSDSPWMHYKLVNVQWIPTTKAKPGPQYGKNNHESPYLDPSTYYLANEVVETDFNLQFFSGQFQAGQAQLITDFATASQQQQGFADNNGQYFNVVHAGKGFNMGGCIGCHGVAANKGGDFSFILKNAGKSIEPEAIGDVEANDERIRQLLDLE